MKLSEQLMRLNNDNRHLRLAKRRYESMMKDTCTKITKGQASHQDIIDWAHSILEELKDIDGAN